MTRPLLLGAVLALVPLAAFAAPPGGALPVPDCVGGEPPEPNNFLAPDYALLTSVAIHYPCDQSDYRIHPDGSFERFGCLVPEDPGCNGGTYFFDPRASSAEIVTVQLFDEAIGADYWVAIHHATAMPFSLLESPGLTANYVTCQSNRPEECAFLNDYFTVKLYGAGPSNISITPPTVGWLIITLHVAAPIN